MHVKKLFSGHKAIILCVTVVLVTAVAVTAILILNSKNTYKHSRGRKLKQSPFSAEMNEKDAAQDLVLPFNAVYRYFYSGEGKKALAVRFGNEPTYFEWIALKTAFTGDERYIRQLKDKIVSFPQADNGYIWSWGDSTYWPTGKGDIHYDGLFRYVAAVSELVRWEGNTEFLNEVDGTTQGENTALDASKGKTVYEKCKAAMDYAYETLDGKSGLITITEKSVYLSNGKTRLDKNTDGEFVWNNTGKAGSSPSNYWDNLCFGNCDAYETMLYYHALLSMSDIEKARGYEKAAEEYIRLAETVKEKFNEVFWSEETGRYIACVDTDGLRWDPGLTFLNTEALSYGLGDEEKAKSVFSWLDGERIVEGDTLKGSDIIDYSRLLEDVFGKSVTPEKLRFVPMTNTVSIEQLSGDGTPWWFDLEGAIKVGEGNNAEFRHHLENGGYIFYTLYYELTAREMYLGADSVAKRAAQLAEVYRFNGFNSDVGGWVEGLTHEFPESGTVSRVFVSSLCGVKADNDALVIEPKLPDGCTLLATEIISYKNVPFSLKTGRDFLEINSENALKGTFEFHPETHGRYTVELTLSDGNTERLSGENIIVVSADGKSVTGIKITPEK